MKHAKPLQKWTKKGIKWDCEGIKIGINPNVIAVVGKGGSGKSIFCAIATRIIANMNKYKLLVVDADPTHPHLSNLLNIKFKKSLEEVRTSIIKTAIRGREEEKKKLVHDIDYIVYDAILETKDFSLLAIGQPEGAGCFCPANTLLKKIITSISKDFDIVLIDCEAGLEQMSREVLSTVNTIVIVSDISVRGLETAKTLLRNSKMFTKYKNIGIVFNKARDKIDRFLEDIKKIELSLYGKIPEDPNIIELDYNGTPISELPPDSQSYVAINEVVAKILNL